MRRWAFQSQLDDCDRTMRENVPTGGMSSDLTVHCLAQAQAHGKGLFPQTQSLDERLCGSGSQYQSTYLGTVKLKKS